MNERKTYLDVQEGLYDLRSVDEKKALSKSDRRDGKFYFYTKEIILAVNVALATGRPLLIKGPSGSGKSSLAFSLARRLEKKYYEVVVTSQSQAKDLLWKFDTIKRLGDAQFRATAMANEHKDADDTKTIQDADKVAQEFKYISPGPLWWVINPNSAKNRGYIEDLPINLKAIDPAIQETNKNQNGALILLDEIDKAEPDFANNLLVPLGSTKFYFDEITGYERWIENNTPTSNLISPLILITTNNERRLPAAFMRRCIVLDIPGPKNVIEITIESERGALNLDGVQSKPDKKFSKEDFKKIKLNNTFLEDIYKSMGGILDSDEKASGISSENVQVNLAIYLDTVRAYLRLRNKYPDENFIQKISRLTLKN